MDPLQLDCWFHARWKVRGERAPPGISAVSGLVAVVPGGVGVLQDELVVADRPKPDVVPGAYPIEPASDRPLAALRIGAESGQHVLDLLRCRAAGQVNRRDAMPMQPVREIPQQRVLWIRSNCFDHQPVSSYSEGDRLAVIEEGVQPAGESLGGLPQVRMPGRIHRALVKDDGELDQKVGELPGKRCHIPGLGAGLRGRRGSLRLGRLFGLARRARLNAHQHASERAGREYG